MIYCFNNYNDHRIVVFAGSDTEHFLRFFSDKRLIPDHSLFTDVQVHAASGPINQQVSLALNPLAFELRQDSIRVKFGLVFAVIGVYTACVKTTDPDNQNGVTWTDKLTIDVRECN